MGAFHIILDQFYPEAEAVGGIYHQLPVEGDKHVAAHVSKRLSPSFAAAARLTFVDEVEQRKKIVARPPTG